MAFAPGASALPKSPDTGVAGCFGPPLSIPYGLQRTTTPPSSALHEIPAAEWDTCYAGSAAAIGATSMFGCATSCLTADVAEATVLVPAAGYDMATSQVGLDEFIKVF